MLYRAVSATQRTNVFNLPVGIRDIVPVSSCLHSLIWVVIDCKDNLKTAIIK